MQQFNVAVNKLTWQCTERDSNQ